MHYKVNPNYDGVYVFDNDFPALLHSGPEPGMANMDLDPSTLVDQTFSDPPAHPLMQSAAAKGTWSGSS